MGDQSVNNGACQPRGRTDPPPSRKRWWALVLWAALLAAILAGQRATALSFEHGYWTPGGLTEPTRAERLWCRLPIGAIVMVAAVFVIGLRWWAPDRTSRAISRAWGIFLSFMAILVSAGISLWFNALVFHMD